MARILSRKLMPATEKNHTNPESDMDLHCYEVELPRLLTRERIRLGAVVYQAGTDLATLHPIALQRNFFLRSWTPADRAPVHHSLEREANHRMNECISALRGLQWSDGTPIIPWSIAIKDLCVSLANLLVKLTSSLWHEARERRPPAVDQRDMPIAGVFFFFARAIIPGQWDWMTERGHGPRYFEIPEDLRGAVANPRPLAPDVLIDQVERDLVDFHADADQTGIALRHTLLVRMAQVLSTSLTRYMHTIGSFGSLWKERYPLP